MELSEFVQKGFQMLADPGSFDSNTFTLLLRAAFQSLLDAQADEAVLGKPLGSELDRPGWRGARRRGARPSEKGKAPGRGSLRALPFAPDGVWGCGSARTHSEPRSLFSPHLAPAHRKLHFPGLIFPSQALCSFVKPVFKSCLWPKRLRFSPWSWADCLTLGLHQGSSLRLKLSVLGWRRF